MLDYATGHNAVVNGTGLLFFNRKVDDPMTMMPENLIPALNV